MEPDGGAHCIEQLESRSFRAGHSQELIPEIIPGGTVYRTANTAGAELELPPFKTEIIVIEESAPVENNFHVERQLQQP